MQNEFFAFNSTQIVSVPEMAAILAEVKHPQPIGFVALTQVKTWEKAYVDARDENPRHGWSKPPVELGEMAELRFNKWFKRIFTLSRVNGWLGSYESMVNRKLAKTGKEQLTFTAKPRQWGERVSLALVVHTKKGETAPSYYLSSIRLHSKPFWLERKPEGILAPLAKAFFACFIPPHEAPTNQGLDAGDEIEPRDYALENVASIALGGKRYRIRHTSTV